MTRHSARSTPADAPLGVEVYAPVVTAARWVVRAAGVVLAVVLIVLIAAAATGSTRAIGPAVAIAGILAVGVVATGPLVGWRTYAVGGGRLWWRGTVPRWRGPVALDDVRAVGLVQAATPSVRRSLTLLVPTTDGATPQERRLRNLFDGDVEDRYRGATGLRIVVLPNLEFLPSELWGQVVTTAAAHGAHVTVAASRFLTS